MPRHIFIDNSNIFAGARRTAEKREPDQLSKAVRVYVKNLARLLEGTGPVKTRVLAGSIPPGNDELWDYARQSGHDTDLLRKINSEDGKAGEQGVDELLHLKEHLINGFGCAEMAA